MKEITQILNEGDSTRLVADVPRGQDEGIRMDSRLAEKSRREIVQFLPSLSSREITRILNEGEPTCLVASSRLDDGHDLACDLAERHS
jgi:hypothetical protein